MSPSTTFARYLVVLGATALGCGVSTDGDPATEAAGSTHALVTITRTASAVTPEEVRADALATFSRLPVDANAGRALAAAGLSVDAPEAGACRKVVAGEAGATGDLTRIELLDAGEVTVAAGGSVTTLAPRAFPTVTDSLAGVVYTTRDRAPEPLPSGRTYTIATSGTLAGGAAALGPISAAAPAPAELTDVRLGETPLAEVESLSAARDATLAWAAGSSGDRVLVVIDAGTVTTECAFRDDAGTGAVPVALLPARGVATLAVHRLRQASFTDLGIAGGELRFDFALEARVTIE